MRFGLDEVTIEKINQIFARYPCIDKVCIYGSRAKGNYKAGSDIDLTLIGSDISHQCLLEINCQLDDLLLPYTIDLSVFSRIENLELNDHIQRVGKLFFSRDVAPPPNT